MVSAPGFEADDVIATLATQAEREGMDVLIVTGDRDALQLVDDAVTVLMTRRGISDMTRFTPEEVKAKYGLTPAQYPDFAALRGDPVGQPAVDPGGGGEDRLEVDHAVRLARRARRPGRRGAGQGGQRAARAPGLRACATGS